jgi:Ca2+-binding EF-hand superfamily protein
MCLATQKIDKNEKQELEKIFKKLDANGDGHLSREELVEGYKKLYKNEEEAKREVEKLMSNMDGDGSGSFEYSGNTLILSNNYRIFSCSF